MANYKYFQNRDGASNDNVRVEYNVTPDIGSAVEIGDTITITGRIMDKRRALKQIECGVYKEVSGNVKQNIGTATKKKNVAQNTWGKFSITITLDNGTFLTQRVEKLSLLFTFVEGETVGGFLIPTTDQYYYWYKWHLDPKLICEGGFQRCQADGSELENGEYLRCDGLKLSINSNASSSDVKQVSMKVENMTSSGATNSDTMTTSQISSMLSYSGYSGVLSTRMRLSLSTAYWLYITVSDGYESVTQQFEISAASIILCFSLKSKGGLAIGQYSNSEDGQAKFEVSSDYKSYFYGGITGINVYEGGGGTSTTRRDTYGRWIDQKKIYRYSYSGVVQESISVSDFSASTLGNIVSMRGMAHRNDGQWIPIPYTRENGNVFNIYIDTTAGAVCVNNTDTNGGGYDRMTLIIEYTLS